MELEKSLVDAFVKNSSNNRKEIATSNIMYGTAIQSNGTIYVKIDGSDSIIPVTKAVDAESGDRVTVTIENHKAVLTGNITNPASLKKIKAEEGYIGGYVITKDQIYNSDGGYGKCVGLGTLNTGWAFYAGANSKDDINGALFRVGHDGKLYAIDATLTGSLQTIGDNYTTHISEGYIILAQNDSHWDNSTLSSDGLVLNSENGVIILRPSGTMLDLSDNTFELFANYINLVANKNIDLSGNTHIKGQVDVEGRVNVESNNLYVGGLKPSLEGHTHWYIHSGSTVGCSAENHFRAYNNDLGSCLDNGIYCGSSNVRWIRLYAANSSIGTSDARLKKDIKPYDTRYEELFKKLQPISYKWKNDGSDNRTDHDRVHTGFIAQQVKQSMDDVGLTDKEFAAFCYDDFSKDPEWTPESTNGMSDRYSLAYEEFISLNTHMIQKLLKQNEELQNRVSILEQKLEVKGDENANIKI